MKKIYCIVLLLAVIFFASQSPVYAFTRDYYVQDKSIVYQVHHTVTKWNTHDDYRFVKYIPYDKPPQFWIAIEISDYAKSIFSNNASVVIDSKKHMIPRRLDDTQKYYLALSRQASIAFYDVSNEVIDAINNCKTSIVIEYNLETREPIVWRLSQGKIQEFKDIILKSE